MSDGLSDRITLTKEEMDEEYKVYRRAKEVRESISHALEHDGISCQELPTPECFPHQGHSTLLTLPDSPESEVCVHVHPVSDMTMVVTVSRDVMIPFNIDNDDIQTLTNFIHEMADYNLWRSESEE